MSDQGCGREDLASPSEGGDGILEHGQFGAAHYFQFGTLPKLRNSLVLAGLAELAANSGVAATWAAVGAAGLSEVLGRVRKLQPDEVVALSVLKRLANGGNMYRVRAAEEPLVAALEAEETEDVRLSEKGAHRLLASMKSRGILEDGAGQWRAVW